jgi:chaperonin cofactor prefoldin
VFESGAADDGSASNDAPKLSKRQQLFKELGERLMRLALPSAKRKELVDHLDDNMNALKKQLHTTEVEKEMFEKQFKELERRRVEEEAKKRGDSSASKMSSGQKLHWIEKELKTATDALTKMGPIADKIASEAAAKKKMDGEEDGEEASLMEEHEAPEIVESIGEPVKEEEEEEET